MATNIDTIIANAQGTASAQLALSNAATNSAITASYGFASPNFTPVSYTIEAVEPDVPDVENANLTYEAHRDQLIALLSNELAGFFITYYPLAADAFDEATNWLVNSITNGGTGLAASVETQIWQRGRDRAVADGARAEAQVLDEFSARGFSLPPGAMTARLDAVRHEGMSKVNEFNRDAAIESAKIEVENVRFAVDNAIQSRMAAMQAATDYIRALMSGPDTAARVAALNSDAKARMMSATSDLYRARLSRDELALRIPMTNTSELVKVSGISMDAFYKGVANRVQAAVAAADQYGKAAQAALSSLNSVASASTVGFS